MTPVRLSLASHRAASVVDALGVLGATDPRGVTALLADAIGAPVVVGHHVGHRGGVELRQRSHVVGLAGDLVSEGKHGLQSRGAHGRARW